MSSEHLDAENAACLANKPVGAWDEPVKIGRAENVVLNISPKYLE